MLARVFGCICMDASQQDFANRLSRVVQRHRALGRGYTGHVRADGLIVVKPRQFRFRLPLRGFVLLMASFMIFKGFLLAYLGAAEYGARLDVLRAGTFGHAGAFVMAADPVTDAAATLFGHLMK